MVRAVGEGLGGQVDILHLDAHPDIYDAFEDNYYSHASPFARIMESGVCRRLIQVGGRGGRQGRTLVGEACAGEPWPERRRKGRQDLKRTHALAMLLYAMPLQ